MLLRARTFHILCSWSASTLKYSFVLIVRVFFFSFLFFFIATKTINMFPECCESEMCFFPTKLKCVSGCPNTGVELLSLPDKITTSNVVPYFQLMGLFLHRQSFSPWGICSLSIKSFATVPHYNPSIWRDLRNECQALWYFHCAQKKKLFTGNIH